MIKQIRQNALYVVWKGMRQRCNNPNSAKHYRYGARKIKVCDAWDSYDAFYKWAIATGYQKGLSIDRIDNNGNYCPENCRWVTNTDQQRNTSRNCFIDYQGKRLTAPEWSEITGISEKLIAQRKRNGWNAERALTAPNNPNQIPVVAIKDGLVYGKYPNIAQAGKHLNVSATHISACLNGKRKRVGGYEWRRVCDV